MGKRPAGVGRLGWWKTACAVCVLIAATAIASPAQTFMSLDSFDGTDGANPYAPLVQAINGSLYGTTGDGGAQNSGTIFKISPSGSLVTLYAFCVQGECADGQYPFEGGLVQATDGNLYGTTYSGGASISGGTVFRITLSGTLTTLYSFCSRGPGCADGANPYAGLVEGTDGGFYGTTFAGGNIVCTDGCGTIFKITSAGALTTLHSFDDADGRNPMGGLVQGNDGNFYGTTLGGGNGGYGTIFKITPSGLPTTLHSFDGADGANPYATLVQAADGNFYGATAYGGASNSCNSGCGTLFKITTSGTLTTLHSFDGADGANPIGALIQAADRNFYGTTYQGATNGACTAVCGTIFQIKPSGSLTTLHVFDTTDGSSPFAGLRQDTNGGFYGTTFIGGTMNSGTVFVLSAGLRPFVKTVPTTGKVGRPVIILGTKLTGATSVTFNGTSATFTVESATAIKATVPSGATTGPVQVMTPSGTLTSNVNFRVEP